MIKLKIFYYYPITNEFCASYSYHNTSDKCVEKYDSMASHSHFDGHVILISVFGFYIVYYCLNLQWLWTFFDRKNLRGRQKKLVSHMYYVIVYLWQTHVFVTRHGTKILNIDGFENYISLGVRCLHNVSSCYSNNVKRTYVPELAGHF